MIVQSDDPASLFRRANDVVRERAAALGVGGAIPFICECSDSRCLARVEMSVDEFAGVAGQPGRAIIVPGHDDPEQDRIVEQTPRFAVVEREALRQPARGAR